MIDDYRYDYYATNKRTDTAHNTILTCLLQRINFPPLQAQTCNYQPWLSSCQSQRVTIRVAQWGVPN